MDKVRYWVEIAEYDFQTARAMLETGRYLYVGSMCHQVAEKMLKAKIAASDIMPPKTHDLVKLAKLAELYPTMTDAQKDFLEVLLPLNISARYPEQRDSLSSTLSNERCMEIMKRPRLC
jgi:HEPN domain-containing protein